MAVRNSKAKATPVVVRSQDLPVTVAVEETAPVKSRKEIELEAWQAALDAKVAAVRAYAKEHYEESGWDIVVEAMDDQQIRDIVWRTRSEQGAIAKVAAYVALTHEVRNDVIEAGR